MTDLELLKTLLHKFGFKEASSDTTNPNYSYFLAKYGHTDSKQYAIERCSNDDGEYLRVFFGNNGELPRRGECVFFFDVNGNALPSFSYKRLGIQVW